MGSVSLESLDSYRFPGWVLHTESLWEDRKNKPLALKYKCRNARLGQCRISSLGTRAFGLNDLTGWEAEFWPSVVIFIVSNLPQLRVEETSSWWLCTPLIWQITHPCGLSLGAPLWEERMGAKSMVLHPCPIHTLYASSGIMLRRRNFELSLT